MKVCQRLVSSLFLCLNTTRNRKSQKIKVGLKY